MPNTARVVVVVLSSMALCGCSSQGPAAPSPLPSPPLLEPASPLPSPPSPRSIATGDYSITFAAQNCTGSDGFPAPPEEARTRTYSARVTQNGSDIRVEVKGSPRIAPTEDPALWGKVEDADSITLTNDYGNDNWDAIFEGLTPETGLAIFVERMKVTISPEGWLTSGEFSGNFWIFDLKSSQDRGSCGWGNHSVRFGRR